MTDLRKFKSQRDIQAGLIACLQAKRFNEITVNDICEQALVGRSTFYHHYPDKYALLEAMVAQQATKFDQLLDQRVAGLAEDAPLLMLYQQLRVDAATITCLLQVHEKDGDLSNRYLHSLARHAQTLVSKMGLLIPEDFAVTLYATTALTAISWALQHGEPEAISHFMNQLMKMVLNKQD
ncbi:MAG: TetR/AcrR family transcriptional regulator [Lactobacillus sp.]|jgi:AcrR family transcriptional regulator|uniref:TetR/AcrR family transcriptional regulator n=1 Tax=Lacticaseibacillus suilingensis TaxID=2799577 RepID=A0ABW4BEI4_9LACO|nr:TetR/AcrR family transcriptional regulator [Lacticaseibacillus suilingensis]MCI1894256.1 TetR/AcrR family transcriptional regulator [Lactobacillus sp.]MCI1916899.1 TetR/AcrR family transcriptional regulator [Lactobacillus sp.]MCI1942103.1 TetR/AcrR family transcriptional regulator [Lactobacillus sp.]MCI1972434.1 TetR/AcrR family transcriptional regulator [Lactobacillus sp.]MCI2017019.1 TetR/AcrR family transcriptional regulator [Lactobacillus sp.]